MKIKTLEEIKKAEQEMSDKLWYNRQFCILEKAEKEGKTIDPEMLKPLEMMEEKYGDENLAFDDDFDWGMLNGKVSALRWILDGEWDDLDT